MDQHSDLERISKDDLRSMLLSDKWSNIAVIDVRDDDHVGGHIRGSLHRPSSSPKAEMPALVRELENKEVVVFHCASSQQRGPQNEPHHLSYPANGSNGRAQAGEEAVTDDEPRGEQIRDMEEGNPNDPTIERVKADKALADGQVSQGLEGKSKYQTVYVLKSGFQEWQEKYGEENDITEDYDKKLWQAD